MKRLACAFTLFIFVCLACSISAQETANPADSSTVVSQSEPRLVIRIEHVTVDDMRLNDTLLIILESSGMEIGGFDLKFGYESRYFDIIEVLPGEIPDSCKWEYFRTTPPRAGEGDIQPRQLWQATGLAKMSVDTTQPRCYGFDRPASLVKLVLSNENIPEVPDHAAPIFFYWEGCRDNVLSDASGQMLLVSASVIDGYEIELPEGEFFPTGQGTPEQCINPKKANHPRRRIDFHNGGVEFKLDLGIGGTDSSEEIQK